MQHLGKWISERVQQRLREFEKTIIKQQKTMLWRPMNNMTHREIASVMKFKTIIHGNCLGINKLDTVLEDDYLSCVIY